MNGVPRHWRPETDAQGIAWLHLDRHGAGVNTLSAEVLAELDAQLERLEREAPAGLVILSGKPSGFIAGADVQEFTRLHEPREALRLIQRGQHLFDRLATLPFPTLALIHGFCLGGGLELALACRYRVARDDPRTRLGLPEVRLGIHPGFGGSMRLPALIGDLAALDLMLSGRTVDARAARRLGLVDHAVPERQMLRAARAMLIERPPPHHPSLWRRLAGRRAARPLMAPLLHRRVARKAPPVHYPAPHALIDIWRRHAGDPQVMLEAEAESVSGLIVTPASRQLVRLFFLRERLKGLGRTDGPPVRHVHVVGAGIMGGDIAAWCALQGLRVSLQDRSPEHIAPALGRAHTLFRRKLKAPRPVRAAFDRILPDPGAVALPRADLVIEAVFEDAGVKRSLYREIEPRMKEGAWLASNTSSIPLEQLAPALQRPERLVGLHFFNPVAHMQLVEVVRGSGCDPEVVRRALAFARAIDRLPLPVASTPGFLVNRVLMPYLLEAVRLESEGVAAARIDRAARAFGMPMGPIELADTVGLDVCLQVARILAETPGREVPPRLAQLVEAGRLGRKSGRGFYTFRGGRPAVPPLARAGRTPDGLIERLLAPLCHEALTCLQEGVVEDADLLDAGMVFGTGFAPFRGGPLQYIRDAGAADLRERLAELE